MIALERAFTASGGAPTIVAVDPRIFALRYFSRCMDCGFCADQCCSYGVDIDTGNMAALAALGPEFETFVGLPRAGWFDGEITADPEFPSGAYGRTATRNGKCVFAEADGRGCRIHAWCLAKGLDYHTCKPLVSTLFPVTFDHGALVASPEAIDGTLICAGEGPTLYEGARSELAWYFGSDFIAVLDDLAALPNR